MQNSFSYIACDEVASIEINENRVKQVFPDGKSEVFSLHHPTEAVGVLQAFAK